MPRDRDGRGGWRHDARDINGQRGAPVLRSPRLDVDLDELLGGARTDSGDAPADRQPACRWRLLICIRLARCRAFKRMPRRRPDGRKLAIDDLGLGPRRPRQARRAWTPRAGRCHRKERDGRRPDAPTMLANFDDEAQQLIEAAARGDGLTPHVIIAATTDQRGSTRQIDRHASMREPPRWSHARYHLDSDDFDLDKLGTAGTHTRRRTRISTSRHRRATFSRTAAGTNTDAVERAQWRRQGACRRRRAATRSSR